MPEPTWGPEFESVDCTHGDVRLRGRLLRPAGKDAQAAVIMFPGGAGPGDSFRNAMRELAGAGYIVVGADMYGIEADISTPQAAGSSYTAMLDAPATLRDRAVVWLETVRALPGVNARRIAAVGYCFGGKCVLELARSGAELQAVISFHGLLTTHAPARPGNVHARIAVWSGGRDPYAPVAELDALRDELDAAGADYQITLFAQAQHSFTDPDHHGYAKGIAYDPMAHSIAWAGAMALLEASIGAGGAAGETNV